MAKKKGLRDIHPPELADPKPTNDLPPDHDQEPAEGDTTIASEAPEQAPHVPDSGDNEPEAVPTPPETDTEAPTGKRSPSGVLRAIVTGQLDPATEESVAGAPVDFCYRPGDKWAAGFATRIAGLDKHGAVLIDLNFGGGGGVSSVPFGSGVGCWRFPRG